ncbi:hypothetical protein AB4Y86_01725, partial [Arthrobacter sp. 2YAF22_2]|uniref:hypothetical protein n=1 Tax=Arthrobacter sp. 2YAF22_2 TaxID=3233029 RepID=UPI003F8F6C6C
FLDSLPRRVACVHSSLRDGKAERALVAVLSVATSAAMAGAVQLEGRSRAVERNIRAGDLTAAKAAAGELDSTIADFAHHVNKLVSSANPRNPRARSSELGPGRPSRTAQPGTPAV